MQIEPQKHALLSPSSSSRWLVCPGSVHLEAATGRAAVYSEAAEVGTVEHMLLEAWVRERKLPSEFYGSKLGQYSILVTEEMVARVESAIRWLTDYIAEGTVRPILRAEEKLPTYLAFDVSPEVIFGTGDVVSWRGYEEALVFDYKSGYVPVDVITSHQLKLYAIGLQASSGWSFDTVRLVIFQPKCGGASEYVVTRAELEALVPWYKDRIDEALDPTSPLVPSEKGCRFCPGAGVCPALHDESVALAKQEFLSPATLTVEQISEVLSKASRIRAALEAVENNALRLIQAGVEVPGWKAVEGRKHRQWRPGSEAKLRAGFKRLGFAADEYEPRKLVTPAQAEKLLKGKTTNLVTLLSEKPKGDATLAPASDSRPALPAEFKNDDLTDTLKRSLP